MAKPILIIRTNPNTQITPEQRDYIISAYRSATDNEYHVIAVSSLGLPYYPFIEVYGVPSQIVENIIDKEPEILATIKGVDIDFNNS